MSAQVKRLIMLADARLKHASMNWQIRRKAQQILSKPINSDQAPIVFFNASTRLRGLSLNAAFSLLSAWSLQMKGVPVIPFVCTRGMKRCVLGTNRYEISNPPPCQRCIQQSQVLYKNLNVSKYEYTEDADLRAAIQGLDIHALSTYKYQNMPLGQLVLPSARWILRRHNLEANPETLTILKDYILSAWSIRHAFEALLKEVNPQSVVVFNGMMYPEAVVRWVSTQHDIPSYSHEVGIAPFSAFFTPGEATAYPVSIPDDYHLNEKQNIKLDDYLSRRFKGKFTMAGQQFWPEISNLDEKFLKKAENFTQIVPVFTNVIFDTSQPHANVIFSNMFEWLDQVVEIAKAHKDTLFIIRAHPDEARPGKASEESVADWVRKRKITNIANIGFVRPDEYFSSYEMIQRAKFIMIYNSTIGLEASIMGKPVLCAGKARFTQLETVFFPKSIKAFREQSDAMLRAESIDVPPSFKENARRFLYFQLYRTSLPFTDFLEEDNVWRGYVRLKDFEPQALLPENSPTTHAIHEGLLHQGDFLLKEN